MIAIFGEAMAMGERTPFSRDFIRLHQDAWQWAKRCLNIAAAPITQFKRCQIYPRIWMAAAGHIGEDAALYDTVQAVALELCRTFRHQYSSWQRLVVDENGLAR